MLGKAEYPAITILFVSSAAQVSWRLDFFTVSQRSLWHWWLQGNTQNFGKRWSDHHVIIMRSRRKSEAVGSGQLDFPTDTVPLWQKIGLPGFGAPSFQHRVRFSVLARNMFRFFPWVFPPFFWAEESHLSANGSFLEESQRSYDRVLHSALPGWCFYRLGSTGIRCSHFEPITAYALSYPWKTCCQPELYGLYWLIISFPIHILGAWSGTDGIRWVPDPRERPAERLPCVVYLHGNCSSRLEVIGFLYKETLETS